MKITKLSDLLTVAQTLEKKRIVVAAAEDKHVLEAVQEAVLHGIVTPILIGDKEKIETYAQELSWDISAYEVVNEVDPVLACQLAATYIKEGRGDFLMKGLVATSVVMRAVIEKEPRRAGRLISHVGILETPWYPKLLGITDPAMNIAPTLDDKSSIIKNAVAVFQKLGVACPKVAVIGAVEIVNPKMPATVEAAQLTVMNMRGQIPGCIVEGPLALDNAVSHEACLHKGIVSQVGGDADILVLPNIESGNVLYKSMTYLGGGKIAGVITGTQAPIVLTSRTDSPESKLYSIACAVIIS